MNKNTQSREELLQQYIKSTKEVLRDTLEPNSLRRLIRSNLSVLEASLQSIERQYSRTLNSAEELEQLLSNQPQMTVNKVFVYMNKIIIIYTN